MPFVTFVIPSYRRPEALQATLDAVLAVDHPPDRVRIVVVDDADDPATQMIVNSRRGGAWDVRYLRHRNGGVAGARNLGAAAASEGLLIFVDDDIIVEPDHVRRHLAARAETTGSIINGHWEFPSQMKQELRSSPFPLPHGRRGLGPSAHTQDRDRRGPRLCAHRDRMQYVDRCRRLSCPWRL